MKRTLAVSLMLAFILGGCGKPQPEAPIRDVRPTKLGRGDTLLVEANGPLFRVGAPTTVTFDRLLDTAGRPLTIEARAVAPDRVLADADERLEAQVGGRHVVAGTAVTVEQTVDGKSYKNGSDPRDLYEMDLFPRDLYHLANGFAARASGGEIFGWLGMEVKPLSPPQTGLQVVSLVQKFSKEALLEKYDRPPLDGEITKHEATAGGMSEAEFKRFDENHDGVIAMHELEAKASDDGLAATAGLRPLDVIKKANDKPVATPNELEAAWAGTGDKVTVDVERAGAAIKVDLPTAGKPDPFPTWLILALVLAIAAGLVALPVPLIAGFVVVWERKVSAYMQSRLGPNRVGPGGWLQWLADGLKLLMKEDIIPTEADPLLFRASPYLAFLGLFLTFIVLPFSHTLIVADMNIGLLFLLSVTSLVVVSIIMGGWSSNSKWALLGGMRSAAQIISYELPASIALLTIATLTGSLSTQKIVEAQGGAPWSWYLFRNPFTFCAFFIWFISALAEGNRTPFDLPEAESELVSGYNTEYSGFRFSLFPMVEWANVFIIASVGTMLFLGGWRIPLVSLKMVDAHWYWSWLGFALFMMKAIALIFVIIWIRWTLPRFRVDQMMNLCWKYFLPVSMACFVGMLAWSWLMPPIVSTLTKVAMFFVFGCLFSLWFLRRVLFNARAYQDLVINDALGRTNA